MQIGNILLEIHEMQHTVTSTSEIQQSGPYLDLISLATLALCSYALFT